MTRWILLIIGLLAVLPAMADEVPTVLQPNTTAFSAEAVEDLTEQIEALAEVLEEDLGSRRTFSPDAWLSIDFATYSAGVLGELGYETSLVGESGWPNGEHTWVLVKIDLEEISAWVPVEASPQPGRSQETLGYVPSYLDEEGNLWFDNMYVLYSEIHTLPENKSPIARIRPPNPPVEPKRTVTFRAIGSYDPDGEIVLYRWDFGDGTLLTSTERYAHHRFEEQGRYPVVLAVIDDHGAMAQTNVSVRVGKGGDSEQADECIPCGR